MIKKAIVLTALIVLLVAGAILAYTFTFFHVVRDKSGVHLLKKKDAAFNFGIVDTTNWNLRDYFNHQEISAGLAELRWERFQGQTEEAWRQFSDELENLFGGGEPQEGKTKREWSKLKEKIRASYERMQKEIKDADFSQDEINAKLKQWHEWSEAQIKSFRERMNL